MSNKTLNLSEKLYQYVLENGVREQNTLRELRLFTAKQEQSRMQISPEQGQFMAMLARLMGAKSYLEIGVYTGYSTLAVTLAMGDDAEVLACDVNKDWTDIAQTYWQKAEVADRIKLQLAPASETLQHLIDENSLKKPLTTFDMAFIDADKEQYDSYYEQCLQLLRPGGLLLIDNVLWSGAVADVEQNDAETLALRVLNKKILVDSRVDMVLLPISDGLTLVIKR